jgi:hypothetical protein
MVRIAVIIDHSSYEGTADAGSSIRLSFVGIQEAGCSKKSGSDGGSGLI